MSAEDAKLLELAGKLSDGDAVDWEAEEGRVDENQRAVVRHLRLLSDIAQVHASVDMSDASAPQALAAGVCQTVVQDSSEGNSAAGPAEVASDEPPRTWGHLEILERLGTGAFGEVYRAWDGTLRRDVALKLLKKRPGRTDGDCARTVLHEGRMMAKVRHPNTVLVHGADVHDDRVGLWMEFVAGRTLEEQRKAQGAFGAHEATLIGIDLCRALAAVHGAGLVHRDVKAHNVMREEGGRIVLMDFGAGEDRSQAAGHGGKISGTPLYIAPEIYDGALPDARSDIYSLGVLLFNLVTGRFPVEANSIGELQKRHESGDFNLLRDLRSDLPDGFVRIVQRAVAHDADDRFATVGQMEEALRASLGIDGAATRPVADKSAASKIAKSVWTIAGLVVVVAAIAAWIGFGGSAYDIDAQLYRVAPDGALSELQSGDRVSPGDSVTLELEASTDLWVYVLERDARGRAYALFPLRGFELQNPLPAGTRHRLPGTRDGVDRTWRIDTVGEREELLIVASHERLPEFEIELGKLDEPDAGMIQPRGMGSLGALPRRVDTTASDDAFRMAGELAATAGERVEGRWMRRFELLNPR